MSVKRKDPDDPLSEPNNGIFTMTPNFRFCLARSFGTKKRYSGGLRARLLSPESLGEYCKYGESTSSTINIYDRIVSRSKKFACTGDIDTRNWTGRCTVNPAASPDKTTCADDKPRFPFRETFMRTDTFPASRLLHAFVRFADPKLPLPHISFRSGANTTLADQLRAAAMLFGSEGGRMHHDPVAHYDVLTEFMMQLAEMYLYLGEDAAFLEQVTLLRQRFQASTPRRFIESFNDLKREYLENGWLRYIWRIVPQEAKEWADAAKHPEAAKLVVIPKDKLLNVFRTVCWQPYG